MVKVLVNERKNKILSTAWFQESYSSVDDITLFHILAKFVYLYKFGELSPEYNFQRDLRLYPYAGPATVSTRK